MLSKYVYWIWEGDFLQFLTIKANVITPKGNWGRTFTVGRQTAKGTGPEPPQSCDPASTNTDQCVSEGMDGQQVFPTSPRACPIFQVGVWGIMRKKHSSEDLCLSRSCDIMFIGIRVVHIHSPRSVYNHLCVCTWGGKELKEGYILSADFAFSRIPSQTTLGMNPCLLASSIHRSLLDGIVTITVTVASPTTYWVSGTMLHALYLLSQNVTLITKSPRVQRSKSSLTAHPKKNHYEQMKLCSSPFSS